MLYFNYLFIKLLILYLYTTVNYCVEFTDFIRNLIRPQGHEKRRGSRKEEVWDRETMFSQLAKRSPRVVVSGKLQYFSHSKYFQTFQKQEANRQRKSEMLKKLKKIISCIFVFLAYRICLSVLKLRGKPCQILTNNNALDRFIGYIVFAG